MTALDEGHLFGEIRALKQQNGVKEAEKMLNTLAIHVKPIMKKRGWKVGRLLEFMPKNPGLLGINVNRGQEIRIRLRPASRPNTLFDFNHLIGTMLHELTHIVRSPHDAVFYKQLDELWTEYEGLSPIREAFDGKGVRVGQGVSRDLPPHLARQKALELAEKRAALSKIMVPEGGRRLGVGPSRIKEKQFSPQELAAMAAERRAADEKTCGQGHNKAELEPENGGEEYDDDCQIIDFKPASGSSTSSTLAAQNSDQRRTNYSNSNEDDDVIFIPESSPCCAGGDDNHEKKSDQRQPSSRSNSYSSKRRLSSSPSPPVCLHRTESASSATMDIFNNKKQHTLLASSSSSSSRTTISSSNAAITATLLESRWKSGGSTWICSICTLENKPLALVCGACEEGVPPPKPPPLEKDDLWSCPACTFINEPFNLKCIVCERIKD